MKSKFLTITSAIALTAMVSCNQGTQPSLESFRNPKASLPTKADSASYAVGMNVGLSLQKEFPDVNVSQLLNGLMSALNGDTSFIFNQMQGQMAIRSYMIEREQKEALNNLEEANKFLNENKKKDGVITVDSLGGLQYQVLQEGTGEHPTVNDTVECKYTGTLIDGTVFDATDQHPGKQPAKFPLSGVIKGWQYGIPLMSVGSKYRFFIHPDIAYGTNVRPGGPIKPNNALIFDVELISFTKGKAPEEKTK